MRQTSLYFLLDEQKRSGYTDSGNVFWSGVPKPLVYAPEGWTEVGIQNNRNNKYFALDRSFTVPLKFVEDGAQILKNQYYKYGIERKVTLLIVKLKLHFDTTLNQYGYFYDLLYMGEVDFSQFRDEGTYVTANIIEGGIPKYIKANENVKFEFNMDSLETILVKLDGVFMKQKQNYIIQEGLREPDHLIGTFFVNQEGTAAGLAHFDVPGESAAGINFATDDRYFLTSFQAISNLTIAGKIKFTLVGTPAPGTIYLKSNLGQSIVLGTYPSGSGPKEVVVNTTFNAGPDEKFFLFHDGANALAQFNYQEGSEISISFRSRFKTTYAKAFRPKYLFEQIVDKNTEGNFTAQSNILDYYSNPNPPGPKSGNLAYTCGNAARGFAGTTLKISLSEFFQDMNGILGVGLGKLNNKVTIEKKADWIDYSDPISLGEVSDQVCFPALDYIFNTWKFGSPEQDYSNVNGRNEFNNTYTFKADITRVTKAYEGVTASQLDCYGLEEIRINFDGKTLSTSDSDNKNWILHIKDTPITEDIDGVPTLVYELDRTLNASATGVDEQDSIFNLFLSTKHNMKRNGSFIHSCFYKMDNSWLRFVTTEKNHNLAVNDNGVLIDEDADEMVGSFDPQLFTPNILEYKTQVPVDLLEVLDGNPLKVFEWTYQGLLFQGIPVKNGIEPESEDVQTYQMLSAPTNNLEPLEQIFDS